MKSEASFASLCGVSPWKPPPQVVRHRLNRGGNRDANRALHMICVVRMGSDRRTRSYVARRIAEGKSKWEIMRCLKRYIAREVYRVLLSSAAPAPPPGLEPRAGRCGGGDRVGLDYKSVTPCGPATSGPVLDGIRRGRRCHLRFGLANSGGHTPSRSRREQVGCSGYLRRPYTCAFGAGAPPRLPGTHDGSRCTAFVDSAVTHKRCSSTESFLATATTARFLAFFPPLPAIFSRGA